eukprot:773283-Amphidinium_carterae.1
MVAGDQDDGRGVTSFEDGQALVRDAEKIELPEYLLEYINMDIEECDEGHHRVWCMQPSMQAVRCCKGKVMWLSIVVACAGGAHRGVLLAPKQKSF